MLGVTTKPIWYGVACLYCDYGATSQSKQERDYASTAHILETNHYVKETSW